MSQSLSAVYIHLVFSTKDRRPLLRDRDTREALHAYLGGVSKTLDCPPIIYKRRETRPCSYLKSHPRQWVDRSSSTSDLLMSGNLR